MSKIYRLLLQKPDTFFFRSSRRSRGIPLENMFHIDVTLVSKFRYACCTFIYLISQHKNYKLKLYVNYRLKALTPHWNILYYEISSFLRYLWITRMWGYRKKFETNYSSLTNTVNTTEEEISIKTPFSILAEWHTQVTSLIKWNH